MIDFAEIKTQIIENGLAYAEMTDSATQKYLVVEGLWNRDQTTTITKVSAGWKIGDFVKTLLVKVSIPEITKENIEFVKSQLQSQYDATVIIKMM